MSAPTISVFLPTGQNYEQLLADICSALKLNIDNLPFAFSAQRLEPDRLLIEFDAEVFDIVEEMLQWSQPSEAYKSLLKHCESYINIHYRNVNVAKQCIIIINKFLGKSSSLSVVENGYGCLLRLSDVAEHLSGDSNWSWERETFPELPGVADSEWIG